MRILYASTALALVLGLCAASVHPPSHAADLIVIARADGDRGGGHDGGRGKGGGKGRGDRGGGAKGGSGKGENGDGGKSGRGGGDDRDDDDRGRGDHRGGADDGRGGNGNRGGGDGDRGGNQQNADRGADSGAVGTGAPAAASLTGNSIGRGDGGADEAGAIRVRGRGWACRQAGALGCESAIDSVRASRPAPSRSGVDPAAYDRDMIRTVQESLRLLGFPPGPIDGIFGPRTRQAVRSYQRENGLPDDGRLSDALVASILAAGTLAELERVP